MAPPVGFSGRRQFDVACGVLSRCVKKAEAATAGKTTMAAAPAAAAAPTTAPPTTMLLMPGADVTPNVREEEPEAEATQLAQLTIMYGDRALVFDDFPSYRVAELVLVAERPRPDLPGAGGTTTTDIPVARKASLQRFMEKRRDRLVARAPYAAARPAPASSNEERRNLQAGEQDAGSSWLGLGAPGGCAC
ncbi:unnamed protein product [Miscanthus lutarioriparius]|uniref:Protein TIFY n=1 Tax=Miscanthus lutarioriparius TaxID=422564 RepID=A0A811MY51_9POAL|nr:unnamed protein product [Miscanthus lutarioriparius]CAD6212514.1 unnamed protein product [Miscanthus lutarioriparius]